MATPPTERREPDVAQEWQLLDAPPATSPPAEGAPAPDPARAERPAWTRTRSPHAGAKTTAPPALNLVDQQPPSEIHDNGNDDGDNDAPAAPAAEAGPAISPAVAAAAAAARASLLSAYLARLQILARAAWRPADVYRRVAPGNPLLDEQTRRTELALRIRADGTLLGATVSSTSAVPALDDEALAVFRRIQPMPHPPPELVDSGGVAGLSFSFELDLTGPVFAERVRRRVLPHFRPPFVRAASLRAARAPGALVRAVVKPDGSLAETTVTDTSGNSFYDAAALEAVNKGAPFPAPPLSLRDTSGNVLLGIGFSRAADGAPELQVARWRAVP